MEQKLRSLTYDHTLGGARPIHWREKIHMTLSWPGIDLCISRTLPIMGLEILRVVAFMRKSFYVAFRTPCLQWQMVH